jgi:hypothetical protein
MRLTAATPPSRERFEERSRMPGGRAAARLVTTTATTTGSLGDTCTAERTAYSRLSAEPGVSERRRSPDSRFCRVHDGVLLRPPLAVPSIGCGPSDDG